MMMGTDKKTSLGQLLNNLFMLGDYNRQARTLCKIHQGWRGSTVSPQRGHCSGSASTEIANPQDGQGRWFICFSISV